MQSLKDRMVSDAIKIGLQPVAHVCAHALVAYWWGEQPAGADLCLGDDEYGVEIIVRRWDRSAE